MHTEAASPRPLDRLAAPSARPEAARAATALEDFWENELDPTLYRFIIRHSLKTQLLITALALASFPLLYGALEVPKLIINQAIGGIEFPRYVLGIPFAQVPYLLLLCAALLALVGIVGGVTYTINQIKGRLGERMLRRIRFMLYDRLLRFPFGHFRHVPPGELIPLISLEIDPLGRFIGDAFIVPIFQGGILVTVLGFVFAQNLLLGAVAVALLPFQAYVVPRLQRRLNRIGNERVRVMQRLADRIKETAEASPDIHVNDGGRRQLARFSQLLGFIYDIRFAYYRQSQRVNSANMLFYFITPFFFYSLGGYMVIEGRITFGSLVAVLAAYRELQIPWRALFDHYQASETARSIYKQVVEQFEPAGMMTTRLLHEEPSPLPTLDGDITLSNVSLVDDEGITLLDGVNATLRAGQHVAIIGPEGSGKSELAALLARLTRPTHGRVIIGDYDIAEMPTAVLGRRLGYVGPTSYIFAGSLRENLLLSLMYRPMREAPSDMAEAQRRYAALIEARRSGNLALDIEADWVDYAAAGVGDEDELTVRIAEVLAIVDLDEDVRAFGLRGHLSPVAPAIAASFLEARRVLARRLAEDNLAHLVEPFDAERYNANATLAENLIFGTPIGGAFDLNALAAHPFVRYILDKAGLTGDLIDVGVRTAETMIELFADLAPDHEYFTQFSFISAVDLPEFQGIVMRFRKGGMAALDQADLNRLLSLSFTQIVARHRLGFIDAAMQERIVKARRLFADELPPQLRDSIEFFDVNRYNAAATLQDNILFGKIAQGRANAEAYIRPLMVGVVKALGLDPVVIRVGLNHAVGHSGARLSSMQRQKLVLARAVLKRPDILILNEASSTLSAPSEAKVVAALNEEFRGRALVWAAQRDSLARHFDQVLLMRDGRLVAHASPVDLAKPGMPLAALSEAD